VLTEARKASLARDSCILLWYPARQPSPWVQSQGPSPPGKNTPRETQGGSMETAGCDTGREPGPGFAAKYFRADQSCHELNPPFRPAPSEAHLKPRLRTARTIPHRKVLSLVCAGVRKDVPRILASRHTAGRGRVSPHPAAERLPARLRVGRNRAQNGMRELQYALLRWPRPLAPPSKGLLGFSSRIPRMGPKPGGHQASQEHQNHQPEAPSPGGTSTSHSSCK